MKHLKGLQRTVLCSALAVLAFGAAPAKAAGTVPTPSGTCVGSDISGGGGADCVTTTGHISASVVGTLSINEMRAISFGNFTVDCDPACVGDATIEMDVSGIRTATSSGTDTVFLMHGAQANDGLGSDAGHVNSGSQSPGHYTVSGGAEEATTTQVYISFATIAGIIVDTCTGNLGGQVCDQYHPLSAVPLTGPAGAAFTVNKFTFNEAGSDVYGHYIDNDGNVPAPGIANPNNPAGGKFANNTAGVADVVVGATLHTVAGITPTPGKYTGMYNVMVSY